MGVIVNLLMCERRGTEVHCTQYILESNCMFIYKPASALSWEDKYERTYTALHAKYSYINATFGPRDRVATAAFWRTFSDEGKISHGW